MRGINLTTLPVRVLDFAPRIGESNQRLTAILDRCPELLDLNLKIGIGMKILDTVPWISREFSQLSATIPDFSETGWFSAKVPLYIISLGNDSGFEVPLQSWCFGQLEYKFSDFSMNSGILQHNFTESFSESDLFSGKQLSLSQEVLQRVDSHHQITEMESSMIPSQCLPAPKFGLPNYQPRLQMSTYTTQLRKTLENNNYFPDLVGDLVPDLNPRLILPHDELDNDELDIVSNLDNINSLLGSDATSQELKAMLDPYTMKPTGSPTPSFSSLTTPPDASLPDFKINKIESPRRHRSNTIPSVNQNKTPYSPPHNSKVHPKLQPKPSSDPSSDPITKPDLPTKSLKERSGYSLKVQLPYHGVLNRADLILQTSIDLMLEDWSPEELLAGRRLIKFHRRHEENTLYCQFDTFSYPSGSPSSDSHSKELTYPLVISVIYWPDLMPDCSHFITSVDLVHLLEGLLEVLFTLEEKNRIRRNLELFGPITITKGSPTTGSLFRQIMQFPSPRPRHIEKGIKVFPYHQLAPMLRKVVGKHTASRSSTLRVNLLPLAKLSKSLPLPPHSS